jgi:hypothetical protein
MRTVYDHSSYHYFHKDSYYTTNTQIVKGFVRFQSASDRNREDNQGERKCPVCFTICGYKTAIITGNLLRGIRYLVSPRIAGIIAIVSIAFFTFLVGADSAVVLAAVLGSLLMWS